MKPRQAPTDPLERYWHERDRLIRHLEKRFSRFQKRSREELERARKQKKEAKQKKDATRQPARVTPQPKAGKPFNSDQRKNVQLNRKQDQPKVIKQTRPAVPSQAKAAAQVKQINVKPGTRRNEKDMSMGAGALQLARKAGAVVVSLVLKT